MQPMNNRQNGRRRGRNNNQRPQGGGGQSRGGGDSGNRIDNRARGNAAQLLEKYKNLAREAQMAGDRVQTEYYLQFADHYFRVLADSRSRQDEQRPNRQDDRYDDQGGVDQGVPFGFGDEGDMGEPGDEMREQDQGRDQNRERDQSRGRDRDEGREQHRDRDQNRDQNRARRERPERADRSERADRPDRSQHRERIEAQADNRGNGDGSDSASDQAPEREERPARRDVGSLRRRRPFGERDEDGASAAIDVAVLPPAIGVPAAAAEPAETAVDAPAPRRRAVRTRKLAADDSVSADS